MQALALMGIFNTQLSLSVKSFRFKAGSAIRTQNLRIGNHRKILRHNQNFTGFVLAAQWIWQADAMVLSELFHSYVFLNTIILLAGTYYQMLYP